MHYGDSIKLSRYPAGRKLATLLGAVRYEKLERQATAFFGVDEEDFTPNTSRPFGPFDVRGYPVAEYGERALQDFILRTLESCRKRASLHLRTKVTGLELQPNGTFRLATEWSGRKAQDEADRVVIGTGRSGFADSVGMLRSLNIQLPDPTFSIGIRIEMPARLLSHLYDVHKDFKFSKAYGPHKVKSFCFSSTANRGGRLKYCHYQDQFRWPMIFLDGHSYVDSRPPRDEGLGNFALLVQQHAGDAQSWINYEFGTRYTERFSGKPFYEHASAFLGMSESQNASPGLAPSVADLQYGAVSEVFSVATLDPLRSALRDTLSIIAGRTGATIETIAAQTNIIAPEFEFFWPTVGVSCAFETECRGLFVIGDAAGVAQGNLQAAISGIAAAYGIMDSSQ